MDSDKLEITFRVNLTSYGCGCLTSRALRRLFREADDEDRFPALSDLINTLPAGRRSLNILADE